MRNENTEDTKQTGTEWKQALMCLGCGLESPVSDTEYGETVHDDYGLVVEEDEIDHGFEWRVFGSSEKGEKSRVGAPTTDTIHDKGLSANTGWQNEDVYGRLLSSRQREKTQQLRAWNERSRTRGSKKRDLKRAFGKIDHVASALGLPGSAREAASVIYRRALDDDLLPGRPVEGIAMPALYAAARMTGIPRSLGEIMSASRVGKDRIVRTCRYIVRGLSLEIKPIDSEQYAPQFASDLGLSGESGWRARQPLENAKEQEVHSGKSPVGLAAAAVYVTSLLTNEKATQDEVSKIANVSEVTVRDRYRKLLEAEGQV